MSCMKQTTLTQSGALGRVIGWTNFSQYHSMDMDFVETFNISLDLSTICFVHFSGW